MRNSKLYRLLLGVIILFSLFIFQGSSSEDSCGGSGSCADELISYQLGYVSIINHTLFDLEVHFWGSAGSSSTIVFIVKAGQVGLRVSLKPKLYGAFAYKMVNGIKLSTDATNYLYINVKEGSDTSYHVY